MISKFAPAVTELVRKFYVNIYDHGESYFLTWLRGHPIHMDPDLFSAITHTPRVLDFEYPWSTNDSPPHSALVECFAEGQPHAMAV